MSKCSRPLTLILTIILSFSFLSVNSFAADEENLVSSDFRDWYLGSGIDSSFIDPDHFIYNSTYNVSRLRVTFPYSDSLGIYIGSSLIYDLPELKVGEKYQFSFQIPTADICQTISPWYTSDEVGAQYFGENTACSIGIGYLDSNNEFTFYDGLYATINYDNYTSFCGYTYKQSFELTNILGSPVFAVSFISSQEQSILFMQDVSCVRLESESEKKLDGILGWLQELWNSITGGFDRVQIKIGEVITNLSGELQSVKEGITTKLGEVITNLSGVLDSVKEGITTKLGEVITGLTGELRYLGDRIINYLLYLGPEVPENPFKTEESPLTKVQGYIDDVVNYINDFTEDMDDVIDSLSAGIKIFTEFVEDNKWVMILVAVSLFLLVVGRFVGI